MNLESVCVFSAGRTWIIRTVAVCTSAGAGHAALGIAADVNDGYAGGEGRGWRGSLLGYAGLEGGGGWLAARG